jgi:hypothetical protein
MSTLERRRMWQELRKRSWSPLDSGATSDRTDGGHREEGKTMFVWRIIEVRGEQVYQTGYWTPAQDWVPDKNYPNAEEAAKRVRWLHGGN